MKREGLRKTVQLKTQTLCRASLGKHETVIAGHVYAVSRDVGEGDQHRMSHTEMGAKRERKRKRERERKKRERDKEWGAWPVSGVAASRHLATPSLSRAFGSDLAILGENRSL